MWGLGLFTTTGEVLNILKQLPVWCRGLQRPEEQEMDKMSDHADILEKGEMK